MLTACVPDVDIDRTRVQAARVLALRSEPPEARPRDTVQLSALVGEATGTVAQPMLDWAFCTSPRPLAELGPVNRACLESSDESLVPIGDGLELTTMLPDDGCRLFGPEPPPAQPGEPPGRPVDPDNTGGYYQPLRVLAATEDVSLLGVRLVCGLAGASQQQSAEFQRRYQRNLSPTIVRLERRSEPAMDLGFQVVHTVTPSERLRLRTHWQDCPVDPICGDEVCTLDEDSEVCPEDCGALVGCGGAEAYLRFDPGSLSIIRQREAMSVNWYASDGTFGAPRTGRGADEFEAWSDNEWTAPDEPSVVTLWVVVRDDRGGITWATFGIAVVDS